MLLESQIQYVLWYSFLTIVFAVFVSVAFVVVALGVSPVVSEAVARTVFLGVVCLTAVLLKLAFEWNRVRGERQLNASDESFTANFSPSPPE
jgi:predicted ABC-type exoprotein transport system permease subunit